MLRHSWLLGLWFLSLAAWAEPFKCDKPQTLCELVTKRLTIGDKVGVFSDDGLLIAVGEVIEIRGRTRLVRIDKKWSTLLRSHQMEMIDDEKAQNPEEFFRIITPLPEFSWGAQMGAVNFGLGDGFVGTTIDGLILWWLWRDLFLISRLHYASGSGRASDNLGAAGTLDVSLRTFGLSAGLSELFLPYALFSFRLDGEVGFSQSSVTLSGDFNEVQVLNGRIRDGIGLYTRLGAAAIWRRDGIQPELGFNLSRIHYATNPSLYVGISTPVN